MDEETQKIIEEQMKNLPKDIIEAIISVDYKNKLIEITKRQKLLIDQAAKLEMETTLVMIGLEPLSDYVANLQRELEINSVRAKEIAMDVSEHVFKPIRESLYQMNQENKEEGEEKVEQTEPAPKFTDSNEINLNRDQILNEIENPIPLHPNMVKEQKNEIKSTALEVPPDRDIVTIKMTEPTISTTQTIEAKPENKLPEIEKKRPTSGIDPYREPLN